jgi:FAD:protein FMN transferase
MDSLIKETRLMWGMPITVAIVAGGSLHRHAYSSRPDHDGQARRVVRRAEATPTAGEERKLIAGVFDYFSAIDERFSTYKPDSEITQINGGRLALEQISPDMRTVFALAEEVRRDTGGYFNINQGNRIDPSGLVKGWALSNAATMLANAGCAHFYVEAGGDFQAVGLNAEGQAWRVGIRNPFNTREIVKVLAISNRGVATSGTYIRGQHIYNPLTGGLPDPEIVSMTVIGPNVYEADCYATAAFAMGRGGIGFIESLTGFEGYMIDSNKLATFTTGFERYIDHENNR